VSRVPGSLVAVFRPRIPQVPSVTVDEVEALLDDGALLVDIREKNEWDEARIAGAAFKPMSTINDWWTDLPRDRTVVLYCRSGNRSAHAVNALVGQAGLDNVLNLTGGILAWAASGRETER
jgi:rhodanese-related sulfurtransferase